MITIEKTNYKLPEDIRILSPDFVAAYSKCKMFPELSQFSEQQWIERAQKGKKINLSEINPDEILDMYQNINECVSWKIVKVFDEYLNYGKMRMPVILKQSDNLYKIIDGKTSLGLFNHYKKDLPVWLIDESLLSTDFKKILEKKIENFSSLYDYRNISDNDKKLVKEIISILEKDNNYAMSNQLKVTFKLTDTNVYDIEKSEFFKACQKHNINLQKQGIVTVMENNITTEYPVISICEDIRRLNNFIKNISKKDEN